MEHDTIRSNLMDEAFEASTEAELTMLANRLELIQAIDQRFPLADKREVGLPRVTVHKPAMSSLDQ